MAPLTRHTRIPAWAGALLLLSGCAGELRGNEDDYRALVQTQVGCDRIAEVFTEECGACHNPTAKLGELDLTEDFESRLVDIPSADPNCASRKLVDPLNPAASFLLEKVTSKTPECGDQMPFGLRLDPADLACIRGWIAGFGAAGDGGGPTTDGGTNPTTDGALE